MDEIIKSEILFEDNKVFHKRTQPSENLILTQNQELRKNPGVINDLGKQSGHVWGRWVAQIPMIVWEKAIRDGYGLNCTDKDIARKEVARFLRSEEGKKCLIQGD